MDAFINFVRALSVISVVLAALWLLVPSGNSAQMFRYAMGVFIISVIVSTLGVSFSNPPEIPSFADYKEETSVAESITNSTARYVIEQLLDSCNIKFKEVEIITDNSVGSDINITKARVELQNPEDFNRAAEIVKNQTGIILVC